MLRTFEISGNMYYEKTYSGSWKKKIVCPRCKRQAILSYRERPSIHIDGIVGKFPGHFYVCKDGCKMEISTKSTVRKNEEIEKQKLKFENNNDLICAVLKIHNRRGNKDIRITASQIEKDLNMKKGWISKKINQIDYYRPVEQSVIEDIQQLK